MSILENVLSLLIEKHTDNKYISKKSEQIFDNLLNLSQNNAQSYLTVIQKSLLKLNTYDS